jgi:hypothetical protein
MSNRYNQDVTATRNARDVPLLARSGAVGRYQLALGQGQVAFSADCDDEVFG